MNEIIRSEAQLPGTLPDLSRFVLVGREKLTAVRAEIRAIEKVGLAKEVHEQKLREAQAIAEAVLDAEVRIGELTAAMPKASGARTDLEPTDSGVQRLETKKQALEEIGMTERQASRFETLARHPEIVQEAKDTARRKNDIVNRSNVLKAIAGSKQPKRNATQMAKEEHEAFKQAESKGVVSIQQIKNDKINKQILSGELAQEMIKLLNAIINFGEHDVIELETMVNCKFSDEERKVFVNECTTAIKIITRLSMAFLKGDK